VRLAVSACAVDGVAAPDAWWVRPGCLHAWAGCMLLVGSGVGSSSLYDNTGRHRAFPGCDGGLEQFWGGWLASSSLVRA
jgi:hypothetical protein